MAVSEELGGDGREISRLCTELVSREEDMRRRQAPWQAMRGSNSRRITRPIRTLARGARAVGQRVRLLGCLCYWWATRQLGPRLQQRQAQRVIQNSPLFDGDWYLRGNPDVAAAGINPLVHFLSWGAAEGRNPSPYFDTGWYCQQNPDVVAAGVNPLSHYVQWGMREKRTPLPPDRHFFLARDNSGDAKHLLYCDLKLPAEDRDSGSLRVCNLMRILMSLGYRISFLPVNLQPTQPFLDRLRQMGIFAMCGPGFTSLDDILARYGGYFDVAIVSRVNVAEVCMNLVRKHCPKASVIFDTTDLHFLREQRHAELINDDAMRTKALATKQKEVGFMEQADLTLVVSPAEVELLRQEAPRARARVRIVSNIHEIYGCAASFAQRNDLLFIGGFDHLPNVDAVKWLARDIFPQLRQRLPGVRLFVLGSDPPDEVRALDEPDFRVVGYVPDVAPYFRSCRASVVPLRYGAGVKGKINLSMSHGLPVVATSMGCEGMFLEDGRDVLIADDAGAFAEAVCRLYRDEPLWNRLSAGGLENVREHFSFEAAGKALRNILFGELASAG